MNKQDGLKHKYNVTKVDDGSTVLDCFVLRPEKDNAAWHAVMEYAYQTSNKELAEDLRAWCNDILDRQLENEWNRRRKERLDRPKPF